nr:hypothetical protein BaRGS_025667 [Batillaria attramentaria]
MTLALLLLLLLLPTLSEGQCIVSPDNVTLARLAFLENTTAILSRQLLLQQFYMEEKVRTDGQSGVKQVRILRDGPKSYYPASFTSRTVASTHEHADHDRTCGIGELSVVLNGVEFRTRHLDYKLIMPSRTSSLYGVTEEIPYPEVPPEVTSKPSIAEQVTEMKEWFRAWRDENTAHRDYRPYFKKSPVLPGGAWYNFDDVVEISESDRHQTDATSWFDVEEQSRYTAYSGDKNLMENYSQLPRTIINMTKDGVPMFAQWNYRTLCHPINTDLKRSDFRLAPKANLHMILTRFSEEKSHTKFLPDRGQQHPANTQTVTHPRPRASKLDGQENPNKYYRLNKLDEIMKEIPGPDNYVGNITDTVLGLTKMDAFGEVAGQGAPEDRKRLVLNTAFFHRWFRTSERSASGQEYVLRGFSDSSMFVAQTTQPNVAPIHVKLCKFPHRWHKNCEKYTRRFSFAIPLEVVVLTPLQAWNPYQLVHKGDHKSDWGRTVTEGGGRTGHISDPQMAYNGTNSAKFYRVPDEFFTGAIVDKGMADTARVKVGVLDPAGNVKVVRASGVRTFIPEIPGVGVLRQRYPIMPVHAEGSPIWKELEALKDVVMEMENFKTYFRQEPMPGTGTDTDCEK